MIVSEIERLIQLFAKLPGLGPRSARRVALHLLNRRDALLVPLVAGLSEAAARVKPCSTCGNLDVAYILWRALSAAARVPSSRNSSSPPTGTPCASRVTATSQSASRSVM